MPEVDYVKEDIRRSVLKGGSRSYREQSALRYSRHWVGC